MNNQSNENLSGCNADPADKAKNICDATAELSEEAMESVAGGAATAHPDFDWRKAGSSVKLQTGVLNPKGFEPVTF